MATNPNPDMTPQQQSEHVGKMIDALQRARPLILNGKAKLILIGSINHSTNNIDVVTYTTEIQYYGQ